MWAEWLVTLVNAWHLNVPTQDKQWRQASGPWSISDWQEAAFLLLVVDLTPSCRPEASAKGRGIDTLTRVLQELESATDVASSLRDIDKLIPTALPVHVDKIFDRLPKEGGTCRLETRLKGRKRYLSTHQQELKLWPPPDPRDVPRPCHLVSASGVCCMKGRSPWPCQKVPSRNLCQGGRC